MFVGQGSAAAFAVAPRSTGGDGPAQLQTDAVQVSIDYRLPGDCSGDVAAGGDWEPYSTGRSWTLAAGADGNRDVTVQFRDRAGNTLSDTASTTLDTAAPSLTSLTVTGDGGEPAGYSNDATVTVTVNGTDVIAPASVTACVANNAGFDDANCGLLVAGTRTILSFDLGPGEGIKVVYAKLTDPAGNEVLDTDTIEVDSEAPVGAGITLEELAPDPILGNGYTDQNTVTAHLTVVGAVEQCVYLDGIGSCTWIGQIAVCHHAPGKSSISRFALLNPFWRRTVVTHICYQMAISFAHDTWLNIPGTYQGFAKLPGFTPIVGNGH